MKYRVGDVIRFKTSSQRGVEDDEGTIATSMTVKTHSQVSDVIEFKSYTDWVEKDEIVDHVPKKAAKKAARLKPRGDESIRLMKLAIKEIEMRKLD